MYKGKCVPWDTFTDVQGCVLRDTLATSPKKRGKPSKPSGKMGVALVVMDKSQYIDKCMALLNDTKVYKPSRNTTKKL